VLELDVDFGQAPRISGNPSGKSKSFSIHQLMADAIDDQNTRAEAVRRVQENLKNPRSVLPTLITITFVSNLKPGSLKRQSQRQAEGR